VRHGKRLLSSVSCLPWLFVTASCLVATASEARNLDARAEVPAPRVTSPAQFFGHELGADYVLPNYRQMTGFWRKLDRESERVKVVDIGETAEGRRQLMAIVTSPENHRRLDRWREISRRLALAEGLTDETARELAREGKSIVWIDGGLHASEVLGAQQLMETVYQLVSRSDAETLRILNDCVVLAVHANPDGHDLCADWYMRNADPTKRTLAGLPRLYQKYIGHDNNRDFYASTQAETKNMNRVMYREWYPQIVYNHHQSGPAGTIMFAPPFRDPFNYHFDPLIVSGLDLVGAAMHSRFHAENKPGVTMRRGANYSTWWNGGLRTTAYFHNMIGLLTETIGNPTPMDIPFLANRQLASGDLPFPIQPQKWHFRQSVDYSVTANYAVMDLASRYRETLLYNFYQMGRNAIRKGSRDHWTITPQRIERMRSASGRVPRQTDPGSETNPPTPPSARDSAALLKQLQDPALRDPRGYILPADQPDFLTATKLVNALIETGVTVHRATKEFQVAGKSYPAGSYVIKAAQAFRAHVIDLFEPQDHPNDFQYPGGPPIPPYDSAGWTFAFQMGVRFDRILEGFDGPFEPVEGVLKPPPGRVVAARGEAAGYLLSHQVNDAFKAVNRLLGNEEQVYWLTSPFSANGKSYEAGTLYIPAGRDTLRKLERLAREVGLTFEETSVGPSGEALRLKPARVALWDRYGGSMPSGWARFILEQFEFPFEVVYPKTLDAGSLRGKYDVIVLMTGAVPERDPSRSPSDTPSANIPAEFHDRLGQITAARTVPRLREFLQEGGTILAVGTSTNLAYHLGLPVSDALAEQTASGGTRRLPREKFYIPGSLLQSRLDSSSAIAAGMPERVDFFFDQSPAFRLGAEAASKGVRRIGWYEGKTPLRSGWAWGQERLEDAASVVEAEVGRGKLYLFGPEITFRAQPHGTFKLLFNGIHLGGAERASLP